jgi:hypothetical protein
MEAIYSAAQVISVISVLAGGACLAGLLACEGLSSITEQQDAAGSSAARQGERSDGG